MARIKDSLVGGILLGMFALALDYFLLQHIMRSPVARVGLTPVVVILYLVAPVLVLSFAGKKDG